MLTQHAVTTVVEADPFGVVPVYYTRQNGHLYTSDSIPNLLKVIDKPTIDLEAIKELIATDYNTGQRTVFKEIRRLPPAHRLYDGRVEKYYDVFTHHELPDDLLSTLKTIVAENIGEDRVGAYLSGGLDTSTIVALAVQNGARVRAFTLGFNDPTDEITDAEIVAKTFGVEHTVTMLDFETFIRAHDGAIGALGRPAANYYGYPLLEEVSKHVKVVLSGEGSDEIFGSYQNSNRFQAIKSDPTKVMWLMRYEMLNKLPFDYLEVDYAMANVWGVQTRVPFCDIRLLGYLSLPWHEKISFERNINKIHLRQAMKDILPERILKKEKQGFSYPFAAYGKELKDLGEEAMADSRMKHLFPEHTSLVRKMMPQNKFVYGIGRKLLRSGIMGDNIRERIAVHHPAKNLMLYSIRRWLDIFNVEF